MCARTRGGKNGNKEGGKVAGWLVDGSLLCAVLVRERVGELPNFTVPDCTDADDLFQD